MSRSAKRITALIPFSLLLLLSSAAVAQEGDGSEDTSGDESSEEAPAEEAPSEDASSEAPAESEPEADAAEAVEEAAEATEEAQAEEAAAEVTEAAAEATAEGEAAEEEETKPEVDLVAELGAIWLMGNTRSITANGLITFAVSGDGNKFGWNFGGAYGRGVVVDADGNPSSEWVENARRIFGGARYDRSIIQDVNSVFFAGNALHDTFAGLRLQAAANVGYAHQIVNTEKHSLAAEAGFNYSYDLFLEDADPADQHFAGARVFLGYGLTLDQFGFGQSIEALFGGRNNLDAPFDGRIISTTSVTANINNILGVKFGFLVNYDIAPPEGFQPVDTTTTLTLVATIM